MLESATLPIRQLSSAQTRDWHREWIVTNGLGGYSSSSLFGVSSRRYHGLLVAALPPPYGRTIMLNHLSEKLALGLSDPIVLSPNEWSERKDELEKRILFPTDFILEGGIPKWHYKIGSAFIEKQILMPHLQNSVYVTYTVRESTTPVRIMLRPSFQIRHHEAPADPNFDTAYKLTVEGGRIELKGANSDLKVRFYQYGPGAAIKIDGGRFYEIFYPIENVRGYTSNDRLWCPGTFTWELKQGESATLVASAEDWRTMLALTPGQAEKSEIERRQRLIHVASEKTPCKPIGGDEADLILAADKFIVLPFYRAEDCTRVRALGEDARSIIAGYPWFTDWGRDTMISLEGLTLCTGRATEANSILRTFSQYVRDGLIPNMFPDAGQEGLYHTADATLWYFHAVDRYLQWTNDRVLLRDLLPVLKDIVDHHVRGTRFGIHVDERDDLLTQGAEGYQLTWMDAKVDGWVVTPRRGKAVEINALWYNALSLLAKWMREESFGNADSIQERADRVKGSFNLRFWNQETSCLFDVIDGEQGDDPAIRPNQIFAVSLPNAVLQPSRWEQVLGVVQQELLTPLGLRTLARTHPDYKMQYQGDLRTRDAAYHQGTVWAWLIGPYIDAYLKAHSEDSQGARRCLESFIPHLSEAGIGSISEVFDADAPHRPRGCPAQAWSVAEVLRCWQKTD